MRVNNLLVPVRQICQKQILTIPVNTSPVDRTKPNLFTRIPGVIASLLLPVMYTTQFTRFDGLA